MPPSILNKTINYNETNRLAPEDNGVDVVQYSLVLQDKERILALGLPKYDYIAENIVYFPIYLIVDEKAVARVGIYEILANALADIKDDDDDDDIDIAKLDAISDPLYFKPYLDELLKRLDRDDEKTRREQEREQEREREESSSDEESDEIVPVVEERAIVPLTEEVVSKPITVDVPKKVIARRTRRAKIEKKSPTPPAIAPVKKNIRQTRHREKGEIKRRKTRKYVSP